MITGFTQHGNWPCTGPEKHLLSLQRLAVKWLHYLAFIPCSTSLPTSSPFCKQQIPLGFSPNLWPFLGQAHANSSARISSSLPSPAPWLCVNTQQKWHLQEILPISVSPCLSHPHLLCFSASLCLFHCFRSSLSLHFTHRSPMGVLPPTLDWALLEHRAGAWVTDEFQCLASGGQPVGDRSYLSANSCSTKSAYFVTKFVTKVFS